MLKKTGFLKGLLLASMVLSAMPNEGFAKVKSPDGVTPGIEKPTNGAAVGWTETVRRGSVLNTYQTTYMNEACKFFGYPPVKIVVEPKHGKFTFTRAKALPNVRKSSRCYNVKIPHVLGHYRPDPAYVGKEVVKIRSTLINGGYAYATITINVR